MPQKLQTTCCIAGGGPAGMMAGYLLARAGIDVIVLEKHSDFFRDFRGDTIHPSTLELMHELGILDDFLKLPHQVAGNLKAYIGDDEVTMADFRYLPTRCKYIALMPQWDFLNFIAGKAKAYPGFHLIMSAQAQDLITENGSIRGVKAVTAEGPVDIYADLVIGADGRSSVMREKADLKIIDLGASMDVLWMRLSREPSDPDQTLGRVIAGKILVMINRHDYWQCAYVIPKDGINQIKANGLPAFRQNILAMTPYLGERVEELTSWEDIKLLTVKLDRLKEWCRPGFLCIGDAAHAMSPIGGVGVNLAVQDAVAAARILMEPLKHKNLEITDLQAVQKRRTFPTLMTQRLQIFIQNKLIVRVLSNQIKPRLGWPFKLLKTIPFLSCIPARIIGLGFRPEHIQSEK